MLTLSDILSSINIQGILQSKAAINVYKVLQFAKRVLYGVQLVMAVRDFVVAVFVGDEIDVIGALLAVVNGTVAIIGLFGICGMEATVQVLTKIGAGLDIAKNVVKLMEARKNGDTIAMIEASFNIFMDIITIFSSCFTGDILVVMEKGYRRIDEIEVGDYVWAYSVETGEKELKEVLQVFVRQNNEILHLETSFGTISTTTNHPFYVVDKGWVAAGDLTIDDCVLTIYGNESSVTRRWIEKLDEPMVVYNLEVEGYNSYFVGYGLLVHNAYDKQSGKSDPHGDGGRALKKADQRIEELTRQLENATGKDAKKIKKTIQNIIEAAQRKLKGETHWRR